MIDLLCGSRPLCEATPENLLATIAKRVLVGDGAMGTQLHAAGLELGACGEHWNITHPDVVLAIQSLPLMAKPNAGKPVLDSGRWLYKQSPEEMAAGPPKLLDAGAKIVGACCGSTVAHIRLFRDFVDQVNARQCS